MVNKKKEEKPRRDVGMVVTELPYLNLFYK
jgi:hypothetical protein